jgi:hypothetical protein
MNSFRLNIYVDWLIETSPHVDLTQKNVIRIVTAVKILNLTFYRIITILKVCNSK